MLHQLESLRAGCRAELRQSEVASAMLGFLSNALYPEKTLQEREYAGVYFWPSMAGNAADLFGTQ